MSALRSLSRSNAAKKKQTTMQRKEYQHKKKAATKTHAEIVVKQRKGQNDGRIIGGCVVMDILHLKYGFSAEKLEKVMAAANIMSKKYGKDQVTSFVVSYWNKRLEEKLLPECKIKYVMDLAQKEYCIQLYEYYCSACAVMMATLVEMYGYSSNAKGTGKLDFIMEWCVNRYIEMQFREKEDLAVHYVNKLNRRAGTSFCFQ